MSDKEQLRDLLTQFASTEEGAEVSQEVIDSFKDVIERKMQQRVATIKSNYELE
jgi:hypothetical protein